MSDSSASKRSRAKCALDRSRRVLEIRKFCAVPGQKAREIVQDWTCTERQKLHVTSHSKALLTASRSLAVRKPFSGHSNKMRQAIRTFPATSDVHIMYQFRKYCYPLEWLELSVQKHYCHPFERLAGAIHSTQNNRQLFELLVAIR